jgi:hypothetical protein
MRSVKLSVAAILLFAAPTLFSAVPANNGSIAAKSHSQEILPNPNLSTSPRNRNASKCMPTIRFFPRVF